MKRKFKAGSIVVDKFRDDFIAFGFEYVGKRNRILDLGCGVKPYSDIYSKYFSEIIGIDVESTPHNRQYVDAFYDGTKIPFENEYFDAILCTEVLEHTNDPKNLLCEMNRVLKPGGKIILTVPFLVPLHEEPYDFFRYTIHGLKKLFSDAGLNILAATSFAENFGVLLSFMVQIQLKFWNRLSKKTRLSFLIKEFNPFILFLVIIPQMVYLKIFKRKNWIKKNMLNYTPIGYGIIAGK